MRSEDLSVGAIRKIRFDYTVGFAGSLGIDINDWKKNPYTYFKSRFYIEMSSLLVSVLIKTKIHPNTITLMYGACGILGAILVAIPRTETILAALVIFFSKGILDWSDGLLARLTGRTSIRGGVLDPWGALLNSLGFIVGVGLYAAHKTQDNTYFYLLIITLAARAGDLMHYTYRHFLNTVIKKPESLNKRMAAQASGSQEVKVQAVKPFLALRKMISGFLDDRARSVDFICLLIILELLYPQFFVTGYIVWAWMFKYLLVFAGGVYRSVRHDWIEKTHSSVFG